MPWSVCVLERRSWWSLPCTWIRAGCGLLVTRHEGAAVALSMHPRIERMAQNPELFDAKPAELEAYGLLSDLTIIDSGQTAGGCIFAVARKIGFHY